MAQVTSLPEFQTKKICKVFRLLYDTNKDGVIEESDFKLLLNKIKDILEWTVESDKYTSAQETLDTVWKGLLKYADYDKDCKITEKEWLRMWEDSLAKVEKGQFPEWQQKYMDLMFDVNDKSGDNFIDSDEYTTFLSEFGVSDGDCQKAFEFISGGKKITRDQFACLWKEYLTSTNTASPGNFLFGPNI